MDSLRGFDDDAGWTAAAVDDEPAIERPPAIGVDERRMHVRAYNYWVSLLDGRAFPSIEDLKPERIGDFGPHSVLLDFTRDPGDPGIAYLGSALRAECELPADARQISDVPSRSLLSRLTDHYLQIIANRAPIGFEAEFDNERGAQTLYRGILMPLSTDGGDIDFIYGVINWKQLAHGIDAAALAGEVDRAIAAAPPPADLPTWADGPHAELPEPIEEPAEEPDRPDPHTLSLWPDEDEITDSDMAAPDEDAALVDRLDFARTQAEQARQADQRSRASLYQALGAAYDFALASEDDPAGYAELLADAGLKRQARAPMTPVAKLVFGAGYDKTRLTEFAAALSHARRTGLAAGALPSTLAAFAGGLKGMVGAERDARRSATKPTPPKPDPARLRHAEPLAYLNGARMGGDAPLGEFVLLLARSEGDGRVAIVAPAVRDARLVAGALAKAAA